MTTDIQSDAAESSSRQVRLIAEALLNGSVVPFLGAGVHTLEGIDSPLPSARELGALIKGRFEEATLYSREDLANITQHVAVFHGGNILRRELHKVFDANYGPNEVHQFLAAVQSKVVQSAGEYQLLVTTNYDDALETAFLQHGQAFDLVTYRSRPRPPHFVHQPWTSDRRRSEQRIDRGNETRLDLALRPTILKLHGSVDRTDDRRDEYVISEDDFLEFIAPVDIATQLPITAVDALVEKQILFLAYGLHDWNLRALLKALWYEGHPLDVHRWAVVKGTGEGPDDPRDDFFRQFWASYQVQVLYRDAGEFVRDLANEVDRRFRIRKTRGLLTPPEPG